MVTMQEATAGENWFPVIAGDLQPPLRKQQGANYITQLSLNSLIKTPSDVIHQLISWAPPPITLPFAPPSLFG